MSLLTEIFLKTLKIWIEESRQPRPSQAKEINNAGGITLPGFKFYYNVTATETAQCQHRNTHMDECNGIEDHI